MKLRLPVRDNAVPKPKAEKEFRSLGDALTQHEPRRVKDHTDWLLSRMTRAYS